MGNESPTNLNTMRLERKVQVAQRVMGACEIDCNGLQCDLCGCILTDHDLLKASPRQAEACMLTLCGLMICLPALSKEEQSCISLP